MQDRLKSKGSADVWVVFGQRADLDGAARIKDWNARGAAVVRALKATANRSQAHARATLRSAHADYTAFWATNRIMVRGATPELTRKLAALPEVRRIAGTRAFKVPAPAKKRPARGRISTSEWNIAAIHADRVWRDFGDRGEGITVASIDSGVQYDHPALVNQYRGNLGNGRFDHNYNWYDPSNICGTPSAPCDNVGHGTHVMGTMVGDDGAGNQIGVAPGATWITAKGCESDYCSDFALIASGQWMLAPTDLDGQDPRPELRPNVVNNSWSTDNGPEIDPGYDEVLQAWTASGIFSTFANGNAGPECDTTGSPADSPYAYGVGSFNQAGAISVFSSRGPAGDAIRPNLAAPGEGIRSSYPTNSYENLSGTSMAAPHVAGTAALVLSAAPALVGDVAATRAVLNESATDVDDESCGGTPGNNNVWGEGKVDALAAVTAAPRGDTGVLRGTVTSAGDGTPIAGATIQVEGPLSRTVTTDQDGNYQLTLSVGDYTVSAHAFGYVGRSAPVTVSRNETTTRNFALIEGSPHSLSGTVTDDRGRPVTGALVAVDGTPLPAVTTDARGRFAFDAVPADSYTVTVSPNGCLAEQSKDVVLDSDKVVDFELEGRTDSFGYRCEVEPADYVEGDTDIGLTGDEGYTTIDLPFRALLYGTAYQQVNVTVNGFVNFTDPVNNYANVAVPNPDQPNAAIYAFWDDLTLDDLSGVYTGVSGTAPNRSFVIEWRNANFWLTDLRIDAEIVLHENGDIELAWRNIDPTDAQERGNSATTGIENADGTDAFQYSFDRPVLSDTQAVRFVLPPAGTVTGTVTDRNDGNPIANATVDVLRAGTVVKQLTTDPDGVYFGQLFAGEYTLRATAENYESAEDTVSISDGATETRNFSLASARAEVESPDLSWVLPEGVSQHATFTITNTGSAPLEWAALEGSGGRSAARPAKAARAKVSASDRNAAARTAIGRYTRAERKRARPSAAGDVLASWPVRDVDLPWGVGYDGDVWISDPAHITNHEFTTAGTPVRTLPAPWAGDWNADMAYDSRRGRMCQADVGGDNGIHCWDRASGEVDHSLTGSPWGDIPQRGLAYRADDDSFYIGGWNENVIYHVAGESDSRPGRLLGRCSLPDSGIAGLAWNSTAEVLWVTTNSPTDDIYEVDPDDCGVITTLGFPERGEFNGAGADLDAEGNLWVTSQTSNTAYLLETGVPEATDVPWLSETPAGGTIAVGESQDVTVTVDTTGLAPGVYRATLMLDTNSGRQRLVPVPVQVVVPGYWKGVNAADGAYSDTRGLPWVADQPYTPGGFGWIGASTVHRTSHRVDIAGTGDDPMYRNYRQGMTDYRFDDLPAGKYQVTLDFAELGRSPRPNTRMFDVDVDGELVLFEYDIAARVGGRRADSHSFVVDLPRGGTLQVHFHARRSYRPPIVNALRVVQRPDL
ncbi:carboxypeptidase regulatory-like domain-containing protein [Actinopolymorpha cephalotaxi]|uniref:Subtilisin family serine protease n=1 Tax=Actinopolymorpha cephalotaxi TaxID=504797 RepID=A0ABX2S4Y3_9ACTN|nr:carboxypeptidase regulatory-like domain-containing protein [Actinopolymorpha cephalotaxi]NYH84669.1 subtilisin family serine protease [Actinopolymorpha cephalotaxi]